MALPHASGPLAEMSAAPTRCAPKAAAVSGAIQPSSSWPRNRGDVRRLWLAFAFGVALHATVQAQQLGASRTVLGTITDSRNRPIVEFGPDDFVVREAGQAREVLSVRV